MATIPKTANVTTNMRAAKGFSIESYRKEFSSILEIHGFSVTERRKLLDNLLKGETVQLTRDVVNDLRLVLKTMASSHNQKLALYTNDLILQPEGGYKFHKGLPASAGTQWRNKNFD